MMLYILDTDICGLVQNAHPTVMHHLHALPPTGSVVTTIITVGEAFNGWLSICRRARNGVARARAYAHFQRTFDFYRTRRCLPFDNAAAAIFDHLRAQKLRVGTNDLAIAAIALSVGGVLVTRNIVDFQRIPGLVLEDWTK
jgi:tRNA(fMet)-specific endonuclease VapC